MDRAPSTGFFLGSVIFSDQKTNKDLTYATRTRLSGLICAQVDVQSSKLRRKKTPRRRWGLGKVIIIATGRARCRTRWWSKKNRFPSDNRHQTQKKKYETYQPRLKKYDLLPLVQHFGPNRNHRVSFFSPLQKDSFRTHSQQRRVAIQRKNEGVSSNPLLRGTLKWWI